MGERRPARRPDLKAALMPPSRRSSHVEEMEVDLKAASLNRSRQSIGQRAARLARTGTPEQLLALAAALKDIEDSRRQGVSESEENNG